MVFFSAFAARGKMDFVFQLLACCVLSVHMEKKQKRVSVPLIYMSVFTTTLSEILTTAS